MGTFVEAVPDTIFLKGSWQYIAQVLDIPFGSTIPVLKL